MAGAFINLSEAVDSGVARLALAREPILFFDARSLWVTRLTGTLVLICFTVLTIESLQAPADVFIYSI